MKRILVPIALLRSEEERIMRVLRSNGPKRVEFRSFHPEKEASEPRYPKTPLIKSELPFPLLVSLDPMQLGSMKLPYRLVCGSASLRWIPQD